MCISTLTDAAPFPCVDGQESLAVVFFELHLLSQPVFFFSSEGLMTCTAQTAFWWWFDHCPFVLVFSMMGLAMWKSGTLPLFGRCPPVPLGCTKLLRVESIFLTMRKW